MTVNKALLPRDNIERQYVSKKEEIRGVACIKEWVDTAIQGLEEFTKKIRVKKRKRKKASCNININRNNLRMSRKKNNKKSRKNGKKIDFMDPPNYKPSKLYTRWSGHGYEKETWIEKQSSLMAAQCNAIRTNYVISKTDYMQRIIKNRLCSDRDEMSIRCLIKKCSNWTFNFFNFKFKWIWMK